MRVLRLISILLSLAALTTEISGAPRGQTTSKGSPVSRERRSLHILSSIGDLLLGRPSKFLRREAEGDAAGEATTEKEWNIKEDWPCPKIGSWRWEKDLCLAVGAFPIWGCKPEDLVMTGRIAICRNKFKIPLIHLRSTTTPATSTTS